MTVLDWHGNITGCFEPLGAPASGTVRLAQARHALDPALRLDLARRFVGGAMRNMRANLSYRAYRGTDAVRPAIAAISDLEAKSTEAESTVEGGAKSGHPAAADQWPRMLIQG